LGFNIGEGKYNFFEMGNNHALIINNSGVASYKKYYPKKESWHYRDYLPYGVKGNTPDDMLVECPYCLGTTSYDYDALINRCENCGNVINDEEVFYV
jgi:hypothetical protein